MCSWFLVLYFGLLFNTTLFCGSNCSSFVHRDSFCWLCAVWRCPHHWGGFWMFPYFLALTIRCSRLSYISCPNSRINFNGPLFNGAVENSMIHQDLGLWCVCGCGKFLLRGSVAGTLWHSVASLQNGDSRSNFIAGYCWGSIREWIHRFRSLK